MLGRSANIRPELKELARRIYRSAKVGTLSDREYSAFVSNIQGTQSLEMRATLLRLAVRVGNIAGFNVAAPSMLLADVYCDAARRESSLAGRLGLLLWAQRWGKRDYKETGKNESFAARFLRHASLGKAVDFVCESDLPFSVASDGSRMIIRCPTRGDVEVASAVSVTLRSVHVGGAGSDAKFRGLLRGWRLGGVTSAGPKPRNEDGFVVASFGDGSLLVAVCDGTGHSLDAARAARIGLSNLVTGYALTGSLRRAVNLAASAIRVDNRAEALDGGATLVGGIVKASSAQFVCFGDSRYLVLSEDGRIEWSLVSLEARFALGGEPLGNIITPSGNLVWTFRRCSSADIVNRERVKLFALMSDGVFVGASESDDFARIESFVHEAPSVARLVRRVIGRALDEFSDKARLDNVTILSGIHLGAKGRL